MDERLNKQSGDSNQSPPAHGCPSFLLLSPRGDIQDFWELETLPSPDLSPSRTRHLETGQSGKWFSPAKATVGCSLRLQSCGSLLGSGATSWELDSWNTSSVRLGGNRVIARGPGNTMVGPSAVLAPGSRRRRSARQIYWISPVLPQQRPLLPAFSKVVSRPPQALFVCWCK